MIAIYGTNSLTHGSSAPCPSFEYREFYRPLDRWSICQLLHDVCVCVCVYTSGDLDVVSDTKLPGHVKESACLTDLTDGCQFDAQWELPLSF